MANQISAPDSTVPETLPAALLAVAIDTFDASVAILTGPELRLSFVNRSFQSLRPDMPMLGRCFVDVFPRHAGADLHARLLRVLESGQGWRAERYEAVSQDGEVRYWDGEVVPTGPQGVAGSVVLFARIVTQSVRTERALVASEEALRRVNQKLHDTIDSITDGVIVLGRDWCYTMVSERAGRIVGMRPEQMIGGCIWDLFPHAVGTDFHRRFHEAMDTGRTVHFEDYYPAPLDLWLECNAHPSAEGLTVYFRDVSQRRRAEAALRESTALLSAISDNSPDVIYAKDAAGRLRFANPATVALIGKPLDHILGHTDAELLADPEAARQVMDNDRRIMDTGVSEELEELVPMPDGQQRIWLSMKTALRDHTGKVVGLLGISRDTTDRKRSEQQLRDENHRKDEFLAMLAHELRNPLAPIVTGARLLDMSAHDEDRVRHAARIIARQAAHMTELVDDLLDVSRVTRGLIELEMNDVDLRAVLSSAIEQARPLIEARRHDFRAVIGAEPMFVHGDQTRLIQTISNLLNNAAKYTPPGGRIALVLTARGSEVEIAVSDSGIGIPPALLPKVFDLFSQGERTPDRSQGGLGLGLALVKSIAAMHGGQVAVQSGGSGQGSRFAITLPRLVRELRPGLAQAPADGQADSGESVPERVAERLGDGATEGREHLSAQPSPAPEPGPATGQADERSRSVMVVDDNIDAGATLAELLEAYGHRVSVQTDGYGALASLAALASRQQATPEVFILDIGLPDMNGYELATRLRATPEGAGATLIALTGYGQSKDRDAGKAAGFDHYVVKPADAESLAQLLAR